MKIDNIYLNLLDRLIHEGEQREDRTGTGTFSLFGIQYEYDLTKGFPLLTTKKIHFKSVVEELLWFLRGGTNSHELEAKGVTIWKEWSNTNGYLGPIYGKQWRRWIGVDGFVYDQVNDRIKTRPYSRISAWNVSVLPNEALSPQENVKDGKMALAPCHVLYQFYVSQGRLSCMMTQRSQDFLLGAPFNIASTALLTHIIAQETGLTPHRIIVNVGDMHLYSNHLDQAKEQLIRAPMEEAQLRIKPREGRTFETYMFEDFELEYNSHPAIKAPIAV